jgi:DNA-binding PadR family transcriptional regulator
MPIPKLTHLQFLVLLAIGARERAGRDIRTRLGKEGASKSLPAFYQLMARLEDAKLVAGSDHEIKVGNQTAIERRYTVTRSGTNAMRENIDFYGAPAAALEWRGGERHGT